MKILSSKDDREKKAGIKTELPYIKINNKGEVRFNGLTMKDVPAIKFAEDDKDEQILYLILCDEKDEDSYTVTNIFETLAVAPAIAEKLHIILDQEYDLIYQEEYPDQRVYRLQKREYSDPKSKRWERYK